VKKIRRGGGALGGDKSKANENVQGAEAKWKKWIGTPPAHAAAARNTRNAASLSPSPLTEKRIP